MKDLSNEIFADMELVEDIIQYVSTATKGFFGRARREYSEICQVEIDDANLKWDHSATKVRKNQKIHQLRSETLSTA